MLAMNGSLLAMENSLLAMNGAFSGLDPKSPIAVDT
jgi:hypothetical protein